MTLRAVHELDPTLLGDRGGGVLEDTSPTPREDEPQAVAWFIAGWHHHHAGLAVEALSSPGRRSHREAAGDDRCPSSRRCSRRCVQPRARVFVGFHRRRAPYTEWIRQDLGLADAAGACDYHCLVHEIELPEHHWYRWPASRSRLVSNGCHWIDHFLYLNRWSRPVDWSIWRGPAGQIQVALELTNGAHFSMTLSDRGSDRLGVRELVEVCSGRAHGADHRSGVCLRGRSPGAAARAHRGGRGLPGDLRGDL